MQTEGVNFEAIWALPDDLVQQNQIKCNDIWKVLHTYGVEAARSSIVIEVQVIDIYIYIYVHIRTCKKNLFMIIYNRVMTVFEALLLFKFRYIFCFSFVISSHLCDHYY